MPDIRRILCPVDFSETSERALRYAIDLAARLGADVRVVHVYQFPVYSLPEGVVLARPEFVTQLTTELGRQLDDLVRRHGGHGVHLEGRLAEGVPWVEIDRLAGEMGADLVVMGTHGRTGVQRFLLGSVAEKVVRSCRVPVLTVRGAEGSS
ncbi:MAG: universal stress protein [Myxococcota bacterium]|nr:universal stress protein [Myxococcota bacterium]MDW8363432.1 universal stress protein [Myxococcales bacterium]